MYVHSSEKKNTVSFSILFVCVFVSCIIGG